MADNAQSIESIAKEVVIALIASAGNPLRFGADVSNNVSATTKAFEAIFDSIKKKRNGG